MLFSQRNILIFAAFVLVLIFALTIILRNRMSGGSRLARHKFKMELRQQGIPTKAKVYQIINSPKQKSIFYQYEVAGKIYSGSADYQMNKDKLKEGDIIDILYSPRFHDSSLYIEDVIN